jgi:ankyrin repeat protein
LLIDKGADVNAKNKYNETPLFYAVKIKDNIEIVKLLIDKGVDVNAKNKYNETPLFYAVKIIDNIEIV